MPSRQHRRRPAARIIAWAAAAALVASTVVLAAALLWARDDARLTAFVQHQLDLALPEHVRVGRVHYGFPASVTVQDLELVDHPGEAPALRLHALSAQLRLRPLLRGHVAIGPTTLDGMELWLDDGPMAAAAAQGATPEGAPQPALKPTRTLSRDLAVVLSRLPAIDVEVIRLRRARVAYASHTTGGAMEDVTADVTLHIDGHGSAAAELTAKASMVAIAQSGRLWQVPQGSIVVRGLSVKVVPLNAQAKAAKNEGEQNAVQLHLEHLAVRARGVDVTAEATAQLAPDDSFTGAAAYGLSATLDDATVQSLFKPEARRALALTGGLQLDGALAFAGSLLASPMVNSVSGTLHVGGHNVGFLHVPLTGITTRWQLAAGDQAALDVFAQVDSATVALRATAVAADGGMGPHRLSLVVQDLPLAGLLARVQPLAKVVPAWREGLLALQEERALWPQSVTVRALAQGQTLWPHADSTLALMTQATGISDPRVPKEALPLTVTASAAINAQGLSLDQLDVVFGLGRIVVHADGSCGWTADEPAKLKITADTLRLAKLLLGSTSPLTASRFKLTLGLSGTPNAPKGHGALQLFAVNLRGKGAKPAQGKTPGGITLGNITLPMNFTGGTLMARGATLASSALHAGLTGFVQLLGTHNKKLSKHAMGLEVRIDSRDVDALLGRPHNRLGPSRVRGQVLVGGFLEAPEVMADLRASGPLGQGTAWASLDDAGAALRKFALAPASGGTLWADGTWRRADDRVALHLEGELPRPQSLGQDVARLSGTMDGTLSDALGVRLALETADSNLLATGNVMPLAEQLDINVAAVATLAELSQWQSDLQAQKPTGRVNTQVRFTGPWATPRVLGTLTASGLGLAGRPLGGGRMQALVQTPEAGHYHVELRAPNALEADIDVDALAQSGVHIEADIPNFALAAFYPPMAIQGADVTGDALVDIRLGRRTLSPRGTLTLRHLVASSRGQTMALEAPTRVRLDGANVGVGRMIIAGNPGRLALEGHVGSVVRASLAGHMALSFVTPFVPALSYARGELTLDAKAYGSRKNPQVEAMVQVTQPVVVRPRGVPIEVRLSTGSVSLTPSKLAFTRLRGGIEGGSFTVQGDIALNDYVPTHYNLHVDGQGIPVRTGDLMVEGNLALACVGTGDKPKIEGVIDIVGGRYLRALELKDFSFVGQGKDTRLPTAYQAPWLKNLALDVHTVSHDGVDIAVNASAFALKARVETDLHIGGNALDPKLTGKVLAREGVITFPRADLRLSMAAIDFETARRSAKNPIGAEVTLRAGGEVVPTSAGGDSKTYEVFMNLDGPPEALALDLSSDDDKLTKLNVLALLSTGNVDLSSGARSNDEAAKLETAEALVGSLVTAPLSRFAQKKIEQVFNVNVDLAIKTSDGSVTVVAAKNINRRIRLEGAYSHGVGLTNTDQSNISTRAQMALTDRLRLEGNAAQSLTGASQSASQSGGMQSNLELKYRLIGP